MGTTSEKLTYLNTTKTLIKEELNLGGANISTEPFRAYSSKLKGIYKDYLANGTDTLWNNWEKVNDTGETLSLTPTIKGKMKVDLKGNTYQYSTTGKNKWSLGDLKIDGWPVWGSSLRDVLNSLPAGSYTFSMKFRVDSVTQQQSNNLYGFILQTSGWTYQKRENKPSISVGQEFDYQFTMNLREEDAGHFTNCYIYGFGNDSVGKTGISTIINAQLETGATATPYEEYTGGIASPNPDYPQDIQVVSGDNTIKVEGRNRFVFNDFVGKNNNNITLSNIENNKITATLSVSATWSTFTYKISNLKKNTKYTLKYLFTNSTSDSSYNNATWIKIDREDGTTAFNSNYYLNDVIVFNTNDNTSANFIFHVTKGGTATTNTLFVYDTQLIEGEYTSQTIPTYTPYVSQTYPISLGNIELCKIGTYQDSIVKDNGKWYLNKQIGKVVLDGTQTLALVNWRASDTSVGWGYNYVNNMVQPSSQVANIYSNKLAPTKYNTMYDKLIDNGIGVFGSTNYGFIIRHQDTSLTTLNAINTYLSSNPIEVYYVLATPTYEEITDTTLLSQLEALAYSYDGTTNISQENDDMPFVLDITALKEMS